MRIILLGLFSVTLARHLFSISNPRPPQQQVRKGRLTRQGAAEDLQPHTDAPVVEPGLRIDADVAGHHGDGQLVEDRDLLLTVSFKYLLMHKGGKAKSLRARLSRDKREIHSFHKVSLSNPQCWGGIRGGEEKWIRHGPCPQEAPIFWGSGERRRREYFDNLGEIYECPGTATELWDFQRRKGRGRPSGSRWRLNQPLDLWGGGF